MKKIDFLYFSNKLSSHWNAIPPKYGVSFSLPIASPWKNFPCFAKIQQNFAGFWLKRSQGGYSLLAKFEAEPRANLLAGTGRSPANQTTKSWQNLFQRLRALRISARRPVSWPFFKPNGFAICKAIWQQCLFFLVKALRRSRGVGIFLLPKISSPWENFPCLAKI
jgi:hypothetical protein